jgi:WD40 repeat protein
MPLIGRGLLFAAVASLLSSDARACQIIKNCHDRPWAEYQEIRSGRVRLLDAKGDYGLDYPGPIWSLASSEDGNRIAVGGASRILRVWDQKQGRNVETFEAAREVTAAAISRDGKVAIAGVGLSGNGPFGVFVVDVDTGKQLAQFADHQWDHL